MERARIWVENNPETGNIKPFEIFWRIEGGKAIKMGSCKTYESAMKSISGTIMRNSKWFQIEVGA